MMRVALLLVVSMPTVCSAGAAMVRSKSSRQPPKGLATQEDLSTGFDGAEDLPTVKATKVGTTVSSSTVAKAGASGPTFDKDDSSADHPNVVDTIPHNYDTNPIESEESGSSIPMFLFIACGGGAVAWLYASDQKRQEAKDKASAAMQLVEPLVRDAMNAMGEATKAAGQAQRHVQTISNAATNASVHLRATGLQPGYKKMGSDDDELLQEEVQEPDPCANPAMGLDYFMDEEPEEVPNLVEQAPPLDLFADTVQCPNVLEAHAPAPAAALLDF
eukprot:gnl/MRDRNA2_/MRDRNA2_28828_c0_seq1.p1 gnl/MRDRNA2_/MRDRNA2_28828_c0~~gnl/MRDRNA2_/MRDRNA2_28828_c0_seq1.p1  ORF type:complete len:274 (+),score=75.69 gnl/MRDRNA2_/MRDRNA2_28828_c0_seq1:85-906(+)